MIWEGVGEIASLTAKTGAAEFGTSQAEGRTSQVWHVIDTAGGKIRRNRRDIAQVTPNTGAAERNIGADKSIIRTGK